MCAWHRPWANNGKSSQQFYAGERTDWNFPGLQRAWCRLSHWQKHAQLILQSYRAWLLLCLETTGNNNKQHRQLCSCKGPLTAFIGLFSVCFIRSVGPLMTDSVLDEAICIYGVVFFLNVWTFWYFTLVVDLTSKHKIKVTRQNTFTDTWGKKRELAEIMTMCKKVHLNGSYSFF